MNVFLDCFSLEDGKQFDRTYMRNLSRSLVAVPFVTSSALGRMSGASNDADVDHVLLEWWLALTLERNENAMLRYILPIFCGEVCMKTPLFLYHFALPRMFTASHAPPPSFL